jgi:hypothetical protein
MLRFILRSPDDVGGAGTIDTSIAADEQLNREPGAAPRAPASFAAAGAAFLAGLKPEQAAAPLGGLEDGDEPGDVAEEGTGAEVAAETITRQEDGATWKPELGRWVNASGQMVAGAAPEGAPAPKAPAAAAAPVAGAPKAPVAGSGEEAAPAEKITLPGLGERGEEDLELEIDDPVVAERLRRLAKEGLRANAFREQRAALETDRAQLQEVTGAIDADPVGFVIRQMTPERQIEVARAVLLEHFDALLPDIEQLASDPTTRANRRVELRDQMAASERQAGEISRARAYAARVVTAVEGLVPEDADPAEARDFVAAARQHLAQLANQGQSVTPDNVRTLLGRHLKYAGFSAPAPAGSAARPSTPAPSVARPATPAAQAIAARSPSVEEATRAAQRVRRVQTQRAAATRVAPAGAGAAPVSVPLLTPEQRTDIRTASRALQKKGLPDTWASAKSE